MELRPHWRVYGAGLAVACLLPVLLVSRLVATKRAPASVVFSDIQSVQKGKLSLGHTAPDILWKDGQTGETKRLSDLRGKPTILLFGSCTCPPFRLSVGLIEQLRQKYPGQFHTYMIYATEAHPEFGQNDYTRNQKTLTDRRLAAQDLVIQKEMTIPILIDTLDNRAAEVFEGMPTRILILDAKGKVVFFTQGNPSSNMAMPVPAVIDSLLSPQ